MPDFRLRFAPSPTGPLHIGGVRTALFNYLLAKQQGGTFILRIEDTDQTRYQEGAEEYILEALTWCGMTPDEGPGIGGPFGPYRQSERKDIYRKYAEQMISTGKAYYAFDTVEELDKMRIELQTDDGQPARYDATTRMKLRNSLSLDAGETERLLSEGGEHTIRMKIDLGEEILIQDLIRGDITFRTEELDDKVILKADGMPTYHLANVVDDYLMKISHVIRGEEWLSSTAHHILLYRYLGWDSSMPLFAHLPLILKPTGKGKLSKRDGAQFGFPVFPIDWKADRELVPGFREFGFDPEALINFLAFLGWNPGTEQEIFSRDELISSFSLEQVVKSGARFDFEKAKWYNQHYIKEKDPSLLADILIALYPDTFGKYEPAFLREYTDLFRERVSVYTEFASAGSYLLGAVVSYDEKTIRKKWKEITDTQLRGIVEKIKPLKPFDAPQIEIAIKDYMEENNLKFGDIFPIMRNAVSGVSQGPDLFRIMALLGKEVSLNRLVNAAEVFPEIASKTE